MESHKALVITGYHFDGSELEAIICCKCGNTVGYSELGEKIISNYCSKCGIKIEGWEEG